MVLNIEKLERGLELLDLEVNTLQKQQLVKYCELLMKWNKVFNLTSIRNYDEVITHHLLDSLAIVPHYQRLFKSDISVLDVGSGGGLPAIPLAIMCPSYTVTMCDTVGKKTAFLTQASLSLGLKNTKIINNRIEKVRGINFDVISSRAFASLPLFVELTSHLLKSDGCWMAMKGVVPSDEIQELSDRLNFKNIIRLEVPFLDEERHLIHFNKAY